MGYLNNQVVTVDAILTKKGRELMARGDGSFDIRQFALSDDEVDYTLYNPNHPSGSAYYGEAIENMPLLEAFPDESQMMKYKLVTLNRGTSTMPTLSVPTNITIGNGVPDTIIPSTTNYLNSNGPEAAGYQFTISFWLIREYTRSFKFNSYKFNCCNYKWNINITNCYWYAM